MPPDLVRKRQRVGRGEAVANAVPLAGGPFESDVQSQPPGRGPFPASPAGWITGHGPVADMAGFSRQGPCRNTRPKHLSRSVQAAAGATRAEGPEEGQVDKPTPCVCEASACRMGTPSGEFRAARCQRHPIPTFPEALPARGPPDLHFLIPRECLHQSDNGQAQPKASSPNPGGGAARAGSGCPDGGWRWRLAMAAGDGPLRARKFRPKPASGHLTARAGDFGLPGEHSRCG